MPVSILIGIALAFAISAMGRWTRMDRDRAFYPMQMMAIAGYYVLFALMGGSRQALVADAAIAGAFVAAALIGFRRSLSLVAVALAAHGIMDLFHGRLVANAGVPAFWPSFCSTYDLTAAGILWWLERRASRSGVRRTATPMAETRTSGAKSA